MTKRRRRIKIKNSSLFAALTILLSLLLFATSAANSHHNHHHHHHHHANLASTRQLAQELTQSLTPATATSQLMQLQQQQPASTLHLCSQLPLHTARQLKLCKLVGHSASVDEALASGTAKGLAECRNQFKNERWNCTHSMGFNGSGSDHSLLTSELAQSVGNRESGFVNAITAAGIVHAIATACSVGSLRDCACDKTRVGLIRRHEDSRIGWGGCSNNIRHGMVYAKHLVELLDAYHQQARHQSKRHQQRGKRALSRREYKPESEPQISPNNQRASTSQQTLASEQQLAFCQKNHNISQAAHYKLIKSLLAKNSLERHQEFRLAMNMHNNKIGRMAVAKNMELRCRCHGLSGSCSLKTCWQTLPDFQLIGAYLRKKYEASVHLPSAVDVNKLIPMMDRAEISAILNGGDAQQQSAGSAATSDSSSGGMLEISSGNDHHSSALNLSTPQQDAPAQLPEYAPLVAAAAPPGQAAGRIQLSGHFIMNPTTAAPQASTPPAPHHLVDLSAAYAPLSAYANANAQSAGYASYYESFKHRTTTTATTPSALASTTTTEMQAAGGSGYQPTYEAQTTGDSFQEIPAYNITPMTQQQYQALIRDMKLCNNSAQTHHQLTTREMAQPSRLVSAAGPGYKQKSPAASPAIQQQQQQHGSNGVKSANHQLSHLLQHSNKDELIHLHKSPDYCEADLKHGFAGIQSRQCSENPLDPDNCDKLCCGRGYTKHIYRQKYDCDCKFQYCCSIWCSVCEREIKVVLCK